MQFITVQHRAVQCICEIQCSTGQYSAIQLGTMQYSAAQCSTVQYSALQFSTMQYSTAVPTIFLLEKPDSDRESGAAAARPEGSRQGVRHVPDEPGDGA